MQESIQTALGKALYVKTEVEDEIGNWNDRWNVRDGFYVIHNGVEHDVYRLIGKEEV